MQQSQQGETNVDESERKHKGKFYLNIAQKDSHLEC